MKNTYTMVHLQTGFRFHFTVLISAGARCCQRTAQPSVHPTLISSTPRPRTDAVYMSQRVPPLDLQPPSKPFIGAPGTAPRPFVVDNTRRWPTPDASWPSTSLVGQPDGLKRRRTGPAPAGGMGPTPPPAPVQGGAPPPRSLESSRCRFAGAPPRGKPPLPERHLRRMKPRSFWERRPSPACTAAAGRGWSRGTPRPLRPCRNVPSRVAPSPPPFPVGPLLSLSHPSGRRLAGSRCARRLARRRRRPPPPAPPSGNRAAAVATHAAG